MISFTSFFKFSWRVLHKLPYMQPCLVPFNPKKKNQFRLKSNFHKSNRKKKWFEFSKLNCYYYSLSRSSGVSLGVPSVLTRRWNVETPVLIWNIPEATACVESCRPPPPPLVFLDLPLPASKSWKLISLLSLSKSFSQSSYLRSIWYGRGRGRESWKQRDGNWKGVFKIF